MIEELKGVWIPAELWRRKDLSLQEKALLVDIDQLDTDSRGGCHKSNKAFGEYLNVSASRVSEIINGLSKKGCIEVELDRIGGKICGRTIFKKGVFANGK